MQLDFVLRDVDPNTSRYLTVLADMLSETSGESGFESGVFHVLDYVQTLIDVLAGFQGKTIEVAQRTAAAALRQAGLAQVGEEVCPPSLQQLLMTVEDLQHALAAYLCDDAEDPSADEEAA